MHRHSLALFHTWHADVRRLGSAEPAPHRIVAAPAADSAGGGG